MSLGEENRLRDALARIDAENAEDPTKERVGDADRPKELVYSERMSAQLERLLPTASEALRLAVRAQHVRRWEVPRDRYPQGRAGYHRWRTELAKLHAAHLERILGAAGYDGTTIERAKSLVRKKNVATDPEAQTLEDVACLVFLEHYFGAFAAKHPDDKVVDILRKTWAKMSERGRAAALELPLGERERALVTQALSG